MIPLETHEGPHISVLSATWLWRVAPYNQVKLPPGGSSKPKIAISTVSAPFHSAFPQQFLQAMTDDKGVGLEVNTTEVLVV